MLRQSRRSDVDQRAMFVRLATRRAERRERRGRMFGLVAQVAALVTLAQASVLAALTLIAAQRKRRALPHGFPHLEPEEVEVAGNRVRLYTYGQDLYDAMLAAIDSARETIFLETFIWKGDALGEEFKRRLKRKADEGVRVYVIYDRFGNLVVPSQFKRFPPRIHAFGYTAFVRPWHVLDPRRYALDHRKLLVVDGNVGFIGGYNIGKLYATKWRDTHMRITGPEVADLAQEFVDFWNRYQPKPARLHMRFARRFSPQINLRTNDAARLIFPIRDMYISAIDRATHHIYITNAYFIPDRVLLDALVDAAKRGVDVQILLPWMSNHVAADWVSRGYFSTCLAAGVRIFGYRDVMIHAKTCTIDGCWSTLGTANLDRLSEVGNHEINVEIYDEAVAHQFELIFARDKTNAFELTPEGWEARPWYVKLSEFILSPLRPVV
jgi:cardiolipin synthase A/B